MADKVDIYIPIYIGDYQADTADLNAEEHGAYLLILMAMWRARAPLPLARLDRVAKVLPDRWDGVWGAIARFFVLADGLVTQRRLMRELDAAMERKRTASERGRKGGLARAQAQADSELAPAQLEGVANGQAKPKPARMTVTISAQSEGSDPSPDQTDPDPSRQSPDRARSEFRAEPNWERHKMPFDATKTFRHVFGRYPNQNGLYRAASAWQAIVEADFPGGEAGLGGAILSRFEHGQLLRHPYTGDHRYRPTFETYLKEFRWQEADSAPDDLAPEKPAETLQQRDARALREGAERRDAELAEVRRKSREAEQAAAEKLRASGGAV